MKLKIILSLVIIFHILYCSNAYFVKLQIGGSRDLQYAIEAAQIEYNSKQSKYIFEYNGLGSDEGIGQLVDDRVLMAITNTPITVSQRKKLPTMIQYPFLAYALSLVYNKPGTDLKLNAQTLFEMVQGNITTMNEIDPTFPNVPLLLYLDIEEKATIENILRSFFIEYGFVNEETSFMSSPQIKWETFDTVIDKIENEEGVITIMSHMLAQAHSLKEASFILDRNQEVRPTMEQLRKAMQHFSERDWSLNKTRTLANAPGNYPLITYAYIVMDGAYGRCDDSIQLYHYLQSVLSYQAYGTYHVQTIEASSMKKMKSLMDEQWHCSGGNNIFKLVDNTVRDTVIFLVIFFGICGLIVCFCVVCSALVCLLCCRQRILSNRLKIAVSRDDGPEGEVTLVFTDIEGFTAMFERFPSYAHRAVALHDSIIREAINEFDGYEVKTEGDSFMIAFGDVINAMLFSNAVQERLMCASWPPQLYILPKMKSVYDKNENLLFHGLKVRIGFVHGEPSRIVSEVNKLRSDYLGTSVNLAARISDFAYGGQTLVDEATYLLLTHRLKEMDSSVKYSCHFAPYATYNVKGISKNQQLYTILPTSLKDRCNLFDPTTNFRGKGNHVPSMSNVDLNSMTNLKVAIDVNTDSGGGSDPSITNHAPVYISPINIDSSYGENENLRNRFFPLAS